ncbi:MAG: hypothetical protein JW963_20910 [Anaerolineales bacterium]|nr:hypothetical protein [Anaerolineales bacterium]
MQFRSIKHESVLYVIAFILAAALRFIQLGALPLSDTEAGWALQAYNVAQGTRPLLGSQPIYILPTSLLFFLFGDSNFLARFLPALAGSTLILVPYLFRERLKPVRALLLAFFLALDPGLVSLSRQAGSLMPALTFVLLAWAFWWHKRPRAAGIFAGLALLSGPSVWAGLLGLGLAWVLRRTMERPSATAKEEDDQEKAGQGVEGVRRADLKVALTFGGATILLGGTLFLLSPNGLSAWLEALPVYLAGWARPSGVSGSRLLFSLVAYQPLAVLFGLVAVVRGWWQGRRRYVRLSLWLVTALLVAIIYPARQVGDLAWALVPLWALVALELSNHMRIFFEERREVAGMATLVLLLLSFAWLDYAGIALDPRNPVNVTSNVVQIGGRVLFENLPPTRYILLFSVLLLLLVSVLMVALGWSARTARLGSVWGLTVALGIYALGMAWGATGLRTPDGWELWWHGKQPAQAELLLATVNEQSEWSTGDAFSQDVTLLGIDSPALEWLLRGRNMRMASALDMQDAPAIIISSSQMGDPNLPIAYRGQDFTWRREPSWGVLSIYEWIKWSVFREMPYDSEMVIVWVRNDLFIDTRQSLP